LPQLFRFLSVYNHETEEISNMAMKQLYCSTKVVNQCKISMGDYSQR